ncbi:MAG: zinc-dependent metalloprotease, partial [Archangium sp.]
MFSRLPGAAAVVCALAVMSCGQNEATMTESLGDEAFVRVARTSQALTSDGGPVGSVGNENFYIAINKSQLEQRWFMSAYLTQWHPAENTPVHSLGTRVVTFKIQNDKLYVFDATSGAKWSDVLDPQRVVEAWPIVTDYAPFNSQAGSSNYVLVDPAAGLNRFDAVSDVIGANYSMRFETELAFLQRYRALNDGVSWEQVFTGYSNVPAPGVLGWDQPFRGSGTMSISLRRYAEGAGFTSSELTTKHYFESANPQYVANEARVRRNVVKWNIKPGMQPIPWRITKSIERLEADPRLAGVDVRGAISRGVTKWNDAFGFPVFSVVTTGADDSFGDDDKNFIVVDPNPGAGLAFANWRENPNTGEIRGASVYFSSVFVEAALYEAGDAGVVTPVVVDAGIATDAGVVTDAGVPDCAASVVISQIFGDNSATGLRNQDYVELHNRGVMPVTLTGWSLQYGSATGTSAWQVIPLTGSIPGGGYFLVGLAATAGGTAIPTADVTSGINLSASNGKVALSKSTTALTGACALSTDVVDTVGYGTTNCSEGTAAPAPSSSQSIVRRDEVGCIDSNVNGNDFVRSTLAPRNTTASVMACSCDALAPVAPIFFNVPIWNGPTSRMAARPSLRWSAMPEQSLCAMERNAAVIPAGMTRKEYLEKYLTHVVLHEVGHTLGLRHNFKGSTEKVSVMDYNADVDAVLLDAPAA